ncbi:MAG: hypothetical protein ACM3ZC_05995 [Bacteroidota bacterium]
MIALHEHPACFACRLRRCLDTVRVLAGDIHGYSVRVGQVDGVRWYFIQVAYESGATRALAVMPACGYRAEMGEAIEGHDAFSSVHRSEKWPRGADCGRLVAG